MKKKLVASLAAAMVLGVAGTSFAAANPFVDVPAKHWAYASVMTLSQAGIVDGYGDGKFQGDKMISRYEMAQIVAKAMAKSDKADAKQKAEIEKLAAEFAEELNVIGVRVTALEKNQANLKFNGTADIRHSAKDMTVGASATSLDARFRLEGTAKIDNVTTFGVRFVNNSPQQNGSSLVGLPTNKSWSKFGNDGAGQSFDMAADRFFITTKVGQVGATIGRQKLLVGNTGAIVDSGIGTFDGLKLTTKMGQVDAAFSYGRLPGSATTSTTTYTTTMTNPGSGTFGQPGYVAPTFVTTPVVTAGPNTDRMDIQVAEFSTTSGKLSYAAGYFGIDNNAPASQVATKELLKLYYGNAKYMFDSKFSMNTEFGQNEASYATTDNTFYTVWATLGDQVLTKAKQHNIQVRHYSVGRNALAVDTAGNGLWTINEGVAFGTGANAAHNVIAQQVLYNYAFSNNLTGQVGYYVGKADNNAAAEYKMLRTVISAKF